MKRIKTDRFKKDMEQTIEHNIYVTSHQEKCIQTIGIPMDRDLSENINQIQRELQTDYDTAQIIFGLCFDCIFFETLCKKDGFIQCKTVKNKIISDKVLKMNHCRMRKTTLTELSEYEQYKLRYSKN